MVQGESFQLSLERDGMRKCTLRIELTTYHESQIFHTRTRHVRPIDAGDWRLVTSEENEQIRELETKKTKQHKAAVRERVLLGRSRT